MRARSVRSWLAAGALCAAALAAALPPADAAAATAPEEVLGYADHLFDRAEYYRAMNEYERFLFLFPGHADAGRAEVRAAESLLRGGKRREALGRLKEAAERLAGEPAGGTALYLLGDLHYAERQWAAAAESYRRFVARHPDDPAVVPAKIKIGLCALAAGEAPGVDPFADMASGPGSELHPRLAEAAQAYRQLPRRSPALAGALSAVLPGAGQLYIGRRADAAVAFLFNGLFLWATVESLRGEHYVTGALLGSVELGWYAGNVYGSYSGASKRNRAAEEGFRQDLLHRLGVAATVSPAGGPSLAAFVRF